MTRPALCRRRLVSLLYSASYGGAEKMAAVTASALAPHYCEVTLLAPQGGGERSVQAGAAGLPGLRVKTFAGQAGLLRELSALSSRSARVDVLSASVGHAVIGLAVVKAARLRAGTHLHVVHGGAEDLMHDFRHKRLLNALPVRLVAVSPFIARTLIASGVWPRKIIVIENFLADDGQAHGAASARAVPPAPWRHRVVLVARTVPMKRLDLVISAARAGWLDDVRIDIYGTGHGLEALRKQAQGLANVALHGHVDDIAERLRGADALLHTSPVEPFGLVVLEAFRAGIPVVVPDAGGTADIVSDGRNGLLYRAGDAASLAAALRRLFALAPERRAALVAAGAHDLATRFSLAHGAAEYARSLGLAPQGGPAH